MHPAGWALASSSPLGTHRPWCASGVRLTHLLAGRRRRGLLATLLSAPQGGAPSPARQSSLPAGEDRTLGWRQKCGILGRISM